MSVATLLPPRPLRGSRLSSFHPPLPTQGPSLASLDSAFQLQEYIALLIRRNPHDVDAIVSLPEKARGSGPGEDKPDDAGERDGKGEFTVDENCWIYEQLRRLAQDLTHPLITMLQQECTRTSCPEMKAGEWLYLCVAHGNDGAMEQCCAIDYILHTLDSATALLNSPRAFPSRLSIPPASVRHFSSLARRLGRIFAHAYFHHREAFEQAEAESSLYTRFLALTSRFSLVPAEFLVIPPRIAHPTRRERARGRDVEPPRLLAAAPDPALARAHEASAAAAAGVRSPEVAGVQQSPRRVGRSRTDTMVHSDAFSFGEDMRGSPDSGGEGRGGSPWGRAPPPGVDATPAAQPAAGVHDAGGSSWARAAPPGDQSLPAASAAHPTEDLPVVPDAESVPAVEGAAVEEAAAAADKSTPATDESKDPVLLVPVIQEQAQPQEPGLELTEQVPEQEQTREPDQTQEQKTQEPEQERAQEKTQEQEKIQEQEKELEQEKEIEQAPEKVPELPQEQEQVQKKAPELMQEKEQVQKKAPEPTQAQEPTQDQAPEQKAEQTQEPTHAERDESWRGLPHLHTIPVVSPEAEWCEASTEPPPGPCAPEPPAAAEPTSVPEPEPAPAPAAAPPPAEPTPVPAPASPEPAPPAVGVASEEQPAPAQDGAPEIKGADPVDAVPEPARPEQDPPEPAHIAPDEEQLDSSGFVILDKPDPAPEPSAPPPEPNVADKTGGASSPLPPAEPGVAEKAQDAPPQEGAALEKTDDAAPPASDAKQPTEAVADAAGEKEEPGAQDSKSYAQAAAEAAPSELTHAPESEAGVRVADSDPQLQDAPSSGPIDEYASSEKTEADESFEADPNTTLEEDLQDVEKVLEDEK